MSAVPKTYEIRTLADIFQLPTREAMETCLRELSEGMVQARIANDAMIEEFKKLGIYEGGMVVEWPEVCKWTDDGQGEVTTKYGMPGGEMAFEMTSKIPTP